MMHSLTVFVLLALVKGQFALSTNVLVDKVQQVADTLSHFEAEFRKYHQFPSNYKVMDLIGQIQDQKQELSSLGIDIANELVGLKPASFLEQLQLELSRLTIHLYSEAFNTILYECLAYKAGFNFSSKTFHSNLIELNVQLYWLHFENTSAALETVNDRIHQLYFDKDVSRVNPVKAVLEEIATDFNDWHNRLQTIYFDESQRATFAGLTLALTPRTQIQYYIHASKLIVTFVRMYEKYLLQLICK